MPSGYEKSPDYGGPEPKPLGIALGMIVLIAAVAGLVFLMRL
jgi:hypothetical protein